MSYTSTFFGRITVLQGKQYAQCLEAIEGLSYRHQAHDILTKEMFATGSMHGYQDISIGFARTYQNMNYTEWIQEFEKFITPFEWDNIFVIAETANEGTKRFEWRQKTKINDQYMLNLGFIEEEKWYFGGGFKSYDELNGVDDEGNESNESYIIEQFINSLQRKDVSNVELNLYPTEDSTKFELQSSDAGLKQFAAALLKAYTSNYKKRKEKGHTEGFENVNLLETQFDISNLFKETSPLKIKNLRVHHTPSNKNWIYKFMNKIVK
ncbi:MAG: hypothetical protein P1U56_22070 [Saprospiraceae bacterium]|nr:hypothetical protein [Saprospiraceae bacterium]